MNAPAISPSSCLGMSRVAFVNRAKYSLTVSTSLCLHPIMECESPVYLCSCMKLVKKRYFSWLKL